MDIYALLGELQCTWNEIPLDRSFSRESISTFVASLFKRIMSAEILFFLWVILGILMYDRA